MEKEIKEIIAKNLPAQVGEVLQARLEQAERDKKDLETKNSILEGKYKDIQELETKIEFYKKQDDRNNKLILRENAVNDAERALAIKTLEYQLQIEKDKSKFLQDVSMGLVRNIEYRSSIWGNENVIYKDQHASYYENKPYDETIHKSAE